MARGMDRPVEGREPKPWLALLMDRHVMLALVGAAFAGLLILKAPSLLGQHASLAGAEFNISPVEGLKRPNGTPVPGFSQRDLAGGVTVVNVWGSWCPHCREEHDALMELSAARKVKLVGLAVHDEPAAARSYLQENGIPYDAVGLDEGGRVSRLLGGVSGVPTTLVIDRNGAVVKRLAGGLSRDRIATELMPAVEKAWAIPLQKRS